MDAQMALTPEGKAAVMRLNSQYPNAICMGLLTMLEDKQREVTDLEGKLRDMFDFMDGVVT